MKPPERSGPDDPHEWLRRAEGNLILARQRELDVPVAELCFNAQQAAEKAFKGLLVSRTIGFPRVHDLEQLVELLEADGVEIPEAVRRATRLTMYATENRYPGHDYPPTEEDYRDAVTLAERVFEWVDSRL